MKISGSGVIASAEYNEEIQISGAGQINGPIKCRGLVCSGAVNSQGDIDVTGDITVSGAISMHGNIRAEGKCKVSGSAQIDGSLKAHDLSLAGGVKVSGGIEAENAVIRGCIDCKGLINAENVEIEFEDKGHAGSVGGGKINILYNKSKDRVSVGRLPLFKRLSRSSNRGYFTVDEAIEGDSVAIERVKAAAVTGRIVAIGAGCEIGTVRYTEEVEISPDAKVGNIVKE